MSRAYRLDGTLASQMFPSSITETMAYDAVKRPTGISMNTSVTSTISQTFDRAGRVTSDARSLNGIGGDAGTGSQSFVYDYLSRLTSSTLSSASRNYSYDVDGNRLTRQEGGTTTTFTYDRTDIVINQVIGGTTKTYSYDRFGNLGTAWDKNSASTTYAYDEANRLTGITPPTGGAITFTVDPLDRHATRSVGGTTADNYGYVGPTETAWSTGLTATPTTSVVDVDGTRLAIKTGSTISWLVFDLHGSVAGLCSGMSLTDAYRYDGFGQVMASSGVSLNPYQYRGLLNIGYDPGTGALLDMGARDYAPQLGQFTQEDSVQGSAANPLTMNRYLYALANPATLIDPDGHTACEADPCDEGATAHDYANGATPKIVPKHKTTNTECKTPGCGRHNVHQDGCDRACERGRTTAVPGAPTPPAGYECDSTYGCTVLDCNTGTAAIGLMGSAQICEGTFGGKVYKFVTFGAGAMAGGGASLTAGKAITNAIDPADLGGAFGSFGSSASGLVVTAGGDISLGRSSSGTLIWVVSGGVGPGAKSLFFLEGHAQGTLTFVFGPASGGSSGGF